MKRFLPQTLGGLVLALGVTLSAPVLAQETIVHPTDPFQTINTHWGSWSDALTTSVTGGAGPNKSTSVTGNTVTLDSGAPEYVLGAVNFVDTDGVSNNTAIINGGTVDDDVVGGYHSLDNGNTSVEFNRVEFNGGTAHRIDGGVAESATSGDAAANGNTVVISGGTVNGLLHGAYAWSADQAEANNNIVQIEPGLPPTVFGANLVLRGGFAVNGSSSNNALLIGSTGLTVSLVDFFQRYEFDLPASLSNGGTVLTVADSLNLGTNSPVRVTGAAGFTVSPGDKYTLLGCSANCTFAGSLDAGSRTGTIAGYPYSLAIDNDSLVLTVLPLQQQSSAAPIPVAGGGVLAALGMLLAGLAVVRLRRQRH